MNVSVSFSYPSFKDDDLKGLSQWAKNHSIELTRILNKMAIQPAGTVNFVPYTGATGDVNLGVHNIYAANITPTVWNDAVVRNPALGASQTIAGSLALAATYTLSAPNLTIGTSVLKVYSNGDIDYIGGGFDLDSAGGLFVHDSFGGGNNVFIAANAGITSYKNHTFSLKATWGTTEYINRYGSQVLRIFDVAYTRMLYLTGDPAAGAAPDLKLMSDGTRMSVKTIAGALAGLDVGSLTIGTLSGLLKGTSGVVSAITDNSTNWNNIYDAVVATNHYTGFPNQIDTSVAFVAGALGATRTLTLYCAGKILWINGTKYTMAADLTKQIDDVTGLYWFWVTAPLGVPQLNASTAAIQNNNGGTTAGFDQCLVATVYWNTTTDLGIVFDERHHAGRDKWQHERDHEAFGALWVSGGTITATDTTFSMTACAFHDEDIEHSCVTQTACRLLRHNGSAAWEWTDNSTTLFYAIAGVPQYNNGNTITEVDNNKYYNCWVYITGAITYPVLSVMGTAQYTNIADARAASVPSFGALVGAEYKLLARVTYQRSGAASVYQETADYRQTATLGTTFVPTDHSTLTKLGFPESGHRVTQPSILGKVTAGAGAVSEIALDGDTTKYLNGAGALAVVSLSMDGFDLSFQLCNQVFS